MVVGVLVHQGEAMPRGNEGSSRALPHLSPPINSTHTSAQPMHTYIRSKVGAASAVLPGLGFDASFLEEPVMLLAFVLLGRALEARAKVRAWTSCVVVLGDDRAVYCAARQGAGGAC